MIVSTFDRIYEFRHAISSDRGIFELVAAGSDCHIEPVDTRSVVYRYPVIGNVIDPNNSALLVGNTDAG